MNTQTNKLIYPILSYKLNGILFWARNELEHCLNKKQYANRIEHHLKEQNIKYYWKYALPMSCKGGQKLRNGIDFLGKNKITVKLKAGSFALKEDYYQVRRYLQSLEKDTLPQDVL